MYSKNCFDFLRFFFAFEILIAHLSGLSNCSSLLFLSNISNSAIAVKGFFVISGFLVAKSYLETKSLKHYFYVLPPLAFMPLMRKWPLWSAQKAILGI